MRASSPDLAADAVAVDPVTADPVTVDAMTADPVAAPRLKPHGNGEGRRATDPVVTDESPAERGWTREPLQRGAPLNFRRHLSRAALRVTVLMAADLACFALLRAVRRMLGAAPWSTVPPFHAISTVFPQGYLNGWQYAVALITGLLVTGNYGAGDRRRDPTRLLAGALLATSLPLWASLWSGSVPLVLLQLAFTTTVVAGALTLQRAALDGLVSRVWHRRAVGERTLQVVCSKSCGALASKQALSNGSEFRVVGQVEAGPAGPGVRAGIRTIPRLLAKYRAEAVAICDHLRREETQFVADAAMTAGCQLLVAPDVFDIAGVQPRLVWRRGDALVELTAPQLIGPQLIVKRAVDLLGAVIGLVVLSPVLFAVSIIVRLDSRGPILFSQQRVGRGGRLFRIVKFRTMVANAESLRDKLAGQSVYQDGRLFKMQGDPRVTRVGGFLRRTSLDELPQLWNVLWGHMSLVGPRPPLPSEVALYEAHHYVRFDVKPGMTGPWQVAGRNQVTDFEKVIALETAYIREWSIAHDVAILARTIGVVLQMRGAH